MIHQYTHLHLIFILFWGMLFSVANGQLASGPGGGDEVERAQALMVVEPSFFIDMEDPSQVAAFARALHTELPDAKIVYVLSECIKKAFIVLLGWKSMEEVKPFFDKVHAKFPKAALSMAGESMFTQILAYDNLDYSELLESTNKLIAD